LDAAAAAAARRALFPGPAPDIPDALIPPPIRYKSLLLALAQWAPGGMRTPQSGRLRAAVYGAVGAVVGGLDLSKWMMQPPATPRASSAPHPPSPPTRRAPLSSTISGARGGAGKPAATALKLLRFLAVAMETETDPDATRALLHALTKVMAAWPLAAAPAGALPLPTVSRGGTEGARAPGAGR
jgi:hypothetical protein